jgi:hypothetical protein
MIENSLLAFGDRLLSFTILPKTLKRVPLPDLPLFLTKGSEMSFNVGDRVIISDNAPVLPGAIAVIVNSGLALSIVGFSYTKEEYLISNEYLTLEKENTVNHTHNDNAAIAERINFELDTLASVIDRLKDLGDITENVANYLSDLVESIDDRFAHYAA